MKRLLLLAGFALATPAMADDPLVPRGTFCSATAADGLWAFRYSLGNVHMNCAEVRTLLAARTSAAITAWNRGYYRIDGMNSVVVRCAGGWRNFTGMGVTPLQQGQQYGGAYWGQSCLFYVN